MAAANDAAGRNWGILILCVVCLKFAVRHVYSSGLPYFVVVDSVDFCAQYFMRVTLWHVFLCTICAAYLLSGR